MDPHFSRSYRVTIKKWKPSETIEGEFISTLETINVLADDIIEAGYTTEDYIECVKDNSDWKTAEAVSIIAGEEIFVGRKEQDIEEALGLPDIKTCDVPPVGWRCTREPYHEGPCAAVPDNGILDKGFKGMPCQMHDDPSGDWSPKGF